MKSLSTALDRVQERARLASTRIEAKERDAPQLLLPGMEEFMRAIPNNISRSSLYAPIAKKGKRTFHRETLLVSRADAVITYTGEQLDEADADLCMQLIYKARSYTLGTPVPLNRAFLLKSINRCTGKHDYDWLHRRMKALTVATLFIEARKSNGSLKYQIGKTKAFHILTDFDFDDKTGCYSFTLDPRWVTLFSNREFSLIDWEKRLQIKRGQDMAKSLQRLVATSDLAPVFRIP